MFDFAERLKETRIKKGLTQQALGTAVGITKAAVSSMERGTTKSATPEHLFKIARVLECDPEWLAVGKKPEMVNETRQPYISDQEKQIIDNYRKLSTRKQDQVVSFIDGLLTASNKK